MKKKIDVVIIGGGISGLTTAYNLLKQEVAGACPFNVTILEAEPETGGQARAFDIEGVTVEHGSHVFFNYYKNIIDMIEELRADPRYGAEIPGFERIPGWTIVDPYGRRTVLKHSPNLPTLLAGGSFRHGQHLAFDQQRNYPLPNLYVSMLQRMGLETDKFASSTGTMKGLEFA